MKNGVQRSRGVNELIRIADAKQIEYDYIKSKLSEIVELIDLEARAICTKATIISTIKCIYSFNHYDTRDTNINKEIVSNKYPRCNEPE